jgi:coenzyme F420-reducing hydrogenase gamma subunit
MPSTDKLKPANRPKVAFFSFTCCEGCQLAVLSCEAELPDIIAHANIVNFREAMTERADDYEIAFIEGSASKAEEIEKLKNIRKKARVVIALGACSSIGGINCLKNHFPIAEVKRLVYGPEGDNHRLLETLPVVPIDSVIKVDHYIHGCPISGREFLSIFTDLMLGKSPVQPNHPVCVDCKMAGNICVFDQGKTCVGPVTRAGCDAICVTYGGVCWGCRGFVDDPNIESHIETLKRCGLSADEAARVLNLYETHALAELTGAKGATKNAG